MPTDYYEVGRQGGAPAAAARKNLMEYSVLAVLQQLATDESDSAATEVTGYTFQSPVTRLSVAQSSFTRLSNPAQLRSIVGPPYRYASPSILQRVGVGDP